MNLALISTAQDKAPLRVGDWQVDARANEIWRGAEKVRLEPKVMQVLCFLSERLGGVVSREELEAVAWPRAIALDPSFARAYSWLAIVYARNIVDGWNLTDPDSLNQALELTQKAKQHDPSVPQIYFVGGYTELFRRNFEAAIRAAEHSTPSPSSPAMRLRAPRLDPTVRWPADRRTGEHGTGGAAQPAHPCRL